MTKLQIIIAVGVWCALAACSGSNDETVPEHAVKSLRESPVPREGADADAKQAISLAQHAPEGQKLFNQRCVYCHDENGWGTRKLAERMDENEAQLAARTHLPAEYVRAVVRNGVGSMPPFMPTELSDEELSTLAAWLAKEEE